MIIFLSVLKIIKNEAVINNESKKILEKAKNLSNKLTKPEHVIEILLRTKTASKQDSSIDYKASP